MTRFLRSPAFITVLIAYNVILLWLNSWWRSWGGAAWNTVAIGFLLVCGHVLAYLEAKVARAVAERRAAELALAQLDAAIHEGRVEVLAEIDREKLH